MKGKRKKEKINFLNIYLGVYSVCLSSVVLCSIGVFKVIKDIKKPLNPENKYSTLNIEKDVNSSNDIKDIEFKKVNKKSTDSINIISNSSLDESSKETIIDITDNQESNTIYLDDSSVNEDELIDEEFIFSDEDTENIDDEEIYSLYDDSQFDDDYYQYDDYDYQFDDSSDYEIDDEYDYNDELIDYDGYVVYNEDDGTYEIWPDQETYEEYHPVEKVR